MDQPQPLFTVILAAGKGTRMKSDMAKVLHEVFYAPMIHHVLKAVEGLLAAKNIVVVGHQREAVIRTLSGFTVDFAIQDEQLGTGHAVLCAEHAVTIQDSVVMILCGDSPLIRTETLKSMYQQHCNRTSTLTIMTTILDDPTNYGRIIKNNSGKVLAIVEEKDATGEQKKIREINAGIYCVDGKFLFDTIKGIGTDNSQGEVYLTDIVSIAVGKSLDVDTFINPVAQDVLGVNSRVELALAHKEIRARRNRDLMLQGVTMHDPETTAVAHTASIGRDTVLYPGVRISGTTQLGSSCIIQDGCILHNCSLADNVTVGAYSYLDGIHCGNASFIPPHTVKISS
jgi:bifunctional UDP-N-acetylglucosamine pyrophosphorylase/glucosamine-1-phosphate N-acetyltransferase